jgi:hypothetical protein
MQLEIVWKLSPAEASYMLNALADRPYKEVNNLLGRLHEQATQQVAAHEKAPADGNSNKGE